MYNKMQEELEREYTKEFEKKHKEFEKKRKEIEENPLIQYSTSQLKAELRRRKYE